MGRIKEAFFFPHATFKITGCPLVLHLFNWFRNISFMRRFILSFSIFIIVLDVASAQIKLGFRACLNLSTIKRTTNNEFTDLPGINTEIFQFLFSDKYFLEAELLLSLKGYHSILIPTGTTSNRLYYLSLPYFFFY